MNQETALSVIAMARHHLDDVVAIEADSYSAPWSRAAFLSEIESNAFSTPIVAVTDDDHRTHVLGYCISWSVDDHVQIQNVTVAAPFRRRGVAERLLERSLTDARAREASHVELEVRRSNRAARRLYEKLGFRVSGERRDFYQRPREDAVLLTLTLEEP